MMVKSSLEFFYFYSKYPYILLKIKIFLENFHSFLIISLTFSKYLLYNITNNLYNLSKRSLHILSFNLSLYSYSMIKIITLEGISHSFLSYVLFKVARGNLAENYFCLIQHLTKLNNT